MLNINCAVLHQDEVCDERPGKDQEASIHDFFSYYHFSGHYLSIRILHVFTFTFVEERLPTNNRFPPNRQHYFYSLSESNL